MNSSRGLKEEVLSAGFKPGRMKSGFFWKVRRRFGMVADFAITRAEILIRKR